MEKVTSFAQVHQALGFKKKTKKTAAERIIICADCGKFMKHITNTNVFACTCGNSKLV